VAGGLRSHAQAGAQHGLYVLGAGRLHDRGGALVDGQVPGPPRLVPAGVGGQHDAPADTVQPSVNLSHSHAARIGRARGAILNKSDELD
jgi:hypothetical protein